MRIAVLLVLLVAALGAVAEAQLAADWMVPAVAHTSGARGTFWRSDVSLHNPHEYDLPVVLQLLPSDTVNWQVPTRDLVLGPWQTLNLWDALGDVPFAHDGTAAMLVYADTGLACNPIEDCHFLVSSRSYTLDPSGRDGEFGQTIPGAAVWQGTDWSTFGYAAGILNDGEFFRCNVGVASWTASWTTLRVDVQDEAGTVIATHELEVPPFGHVQQRLETRVGGGSLVFYLVDGPDDSLVFPYASVVDQSTGDASFVAATPSVVGVSVTKAAADRDDRPAHPERGGSSEAVEDRP